MAAYGSCSALTRSAGVPGRQSTVIRSALCHRVMEGYARRGWSALLLTVLLVIIQTQCTAGMLQLVIDCPFGMSAAAFVVARCSSKTRSLSQAS